MERLQAAIEKARAQRSENRETPPAAGITAPSSPMGHPAGQEGQGAAWAALSPLDTSGPIYAGEQLVAYRPGAGASPYDMLRTRVIQQAQANGWRRIAVVSPQPGSGKTTTIANLAFSLSRQGDLRSLIIDYDLRRATLAKVLGQAPQYTMGDVIDGRVSFAEHALRYGGNVAFGLNRGPVANPSELLQSYRNRTVIEGIEATYQPDLTLFDVPPLLAADDSVGFLRSVDCALIIVAAEETPMSQIDLAERQVAELTQVMGIVLNKCRMTSETYAYDYAGY